MWHGKSLMVFWAGSRAQIFLGLKKTGEDIARRGRKDEGNVVIDESLEVTVNRQGPSPLREG